MAVQSFPAARARRVRRLIFPELVSGNSSTNSTIRGYLYAGEVAPDVVLELAHQCIAGSDARHHPHPGHDHRSAVGVGLRDHSGLRDLRVAHQRVLDLRRTDSVPGALDEVVVAALVAEVAVLAAHCEISGEEPAAEPHALRHPGVAPVAEEQARIVLAPRRDFPHGPVRLFVAGVVDDRGAPAGVADSHRARHHGVERLAASDHVVELGEAVELVDHDAELVVRPSHHVAGQALAAGADDPGRELPALARRRHLGEALERGRGHERVRDSVAGHEVERPLLGEAVLRRDHGLAVLPRGKHGVEPAADPGPVGRGPEHRARPVELQVVGEGHGGGVGMHDAVPVQQPLRQPGRTGRVHEQGRAFGAGRCVLDAARLRGQALVESALVRSRLTRRQHVLEVGEPPPGVAHAAPGLWVGDHDPRSGVGEAVLHGVRSVELGQRHHHRTELVDREVCDGGLGALSGVHRHRVAGLCPEGVQALREAVGERVQIRERVAAHRTVLVLEDEGGVVATRAACACATTVSSAMLARSGIRIRHASRVSSR